jgi:hypothetical protein
LEKTKEAASVAGPPLGKRRRSKLDGALRWGIIARGLAMSGKKQSRYQASLEPEVLEWWLSSLPKYWRPNGKK